MDGKSIEAELLAGRDEDFEDSLSGSWRNQDHVYIVMYPSRKSGGTYTEVRRTQRGLARLLRTLRSLGYVDSEIEVTDKRKTWMPETTNQEPVIKRKLNPNSQYKPRVSKKLKDFV
jgi:hypothetical protein